MQQKTVSLIIPVYNIASYLPACLDSVLAQTHVDLEVICVNDGSADDSGVILDEYAKRDARVKVIHKENGGVSAARNDALDQATGSYIGFVDGDDEIEPDMIEFLVTAMERYDVDIAHCGYRMLHLDGTETLFYGTGEVWEQDHEKGLLDLFKGERIEPGCCNKLYKAELFNGVRFDRDLLYNEDLLMNARLFHNAKCAVFIDECKYRYIRREGSACKGAVGDKHVFHPVKVRERIEELCADESDAVQTIVAVSKLRANMSTYSLLTSKRGRAYASYAATYRRNIQELYAYFPYLGRSGQLHAWMIARVPWLCKPIFGVYNVLRGKSRYR